MSPVADLSSSTGLSSDTQFGNVNGCNGAIYEAWANRATWLRSELACGDRGNCDILTSTALSVSNLGEAFMWGIDFIIAEDHRPGQSRTLEQRILDWTQSDFTMSSAYSGIGTPETSNGMLSCACRFLFPSVSHDLFRSEAYCEIDDDAREELLLRPDSQNACVFGDLNRFWSDKCSDAVAAAWRTPSSAKDLLGPAVRSNRSVVRAAWCYRHNRHCRFPSCTLHVAGSSCTDHSQFGDQLALSGHTLIPKLAWIAQRRAIQEPLVLVENVVAFPEELLESFLGDIYYMQVVKVDASMYWIQKRIRTIILLLHKHKTVAPPIRLEQFVVRMTRQIHTSWMAVLTASRADLDSELSWALARRHKADGNDDAQIPNTDNAFYELLNDTEKTYLESYRTLEPAMPATPGMAVYSLSQDPSGGFGLCSRSRFIHTVIKNCGLLWAHQAPGFPNGRWHTCVVRVCNRLRCVLRCSCLHRAAPICLLNKTTKVAHTFGSFGMPRLRTRPSRTSSSLADKFVCIQSLSATNCNKSAGWQRHVRAGAWMFTSLRCEPCQDHSQFGCVG